MNEKQMMQETLKKADVLYDINNELEKAQVILREVVNEYEEYDAEDLSDKDLQRIAFNFYYMGVMIRIVLDYVYSCRKLAEKHCYMPGEILEGGE